MQIKKAFLFCGILTIFSFSLVAKEKKTENTNNLEKIESLEEKDIQERKIRSISKGIVQITVQDNLGTFGIYAVSPDKSRTPVLSSRQGFSSSSFYLKSKNNTYQLNRLGGVSYFSSFSDNAAELVYTISDKRVQAQVTVKMDIQSTGAFEYADMIKCSIKTVNTGEFRSTYSIRGIFDTILGEMAYTDFSTAKERKIDSEYLISSMVFDRWIMSKNEVTGLQFLLFGKDITSPEIVTLLNKDSAHLRDWTGSYFKKDRPFNSAVSYNNSAIDMAWKDFSLGPNQSSTIVFYIVLGVQAVEPAGLHFLTSVPSYSTSSVPTESILEETSSVIPLETNEINSPLEVDTLSDSEDLESSFDTSSIRQEQLDPGYVQALIKRISSLEDSDTFSEKNELLQLNAELDAILKILKENQ